MGKSKRPGHITRRSPAKRRCGAAKKKPEALASVLAPAPLMLEFIPQAGQTGRLQVKASGWNASDTKLDESIAVGQVPALVQGVLQAWLRQRAGRL